MRFMFSKNTGSISTSVVIQKNAQAFLCCLKLTNNITRNAIKSAEQRRMIVSFVVE